MPPRGVPQKYRPLPPHGMELWIVAEVNGLQIGNGESAPLGAGDLVLRVMGHSYRNVSLPYDLHVMRSEAIQSVVPVPTMTGIDIRETAAPDGMDGQRYRQSGMPANRQHLMAGSPYPFKSDEEGADWWWGPDTVLLTLRARAISFGHYDIRFPTEAGDPPDETYFSTLTIVDRWGIAFDLT